MKKLKNTLVCVLMLSAIAALSGCNTFEGMGRDIQSAGQTITGAAKNNR